MGNDKKAVESQLIRLMKHILKFFIQPTKRTMSWIISIKNARNEIERKAQKRPRLWKHIREFWSTAFQKAKLDAEDETNQDCDIEALDWDTTFNQKFDLDDDPDNDDDKPKK